MTTWFKEDDFREIGLIISEALHNYDNLDLLESLKTRVLNITRSIQ